MQVEDAAIRPIGRGRLIALTLGALAAAALIVMGAVLPAEFNRDPLGLGRATGLSRLWAPAQTEVGAGASAARVREERAPFRTDVIEIPLGGFLEGAERSELEYKVALRQDAVLLYAWEVVGAERADDLRYDFHGHTLAAGKNGITIATYAQGAAGRMQGSLSAPFAGIHGWQFSNGGDAPVVVRVRLAGFYALIPPGRPGNEAGVVANTPATRARPRRVAPQGGAD